MHQVLEAAERIFVSLTGYAGFDRDLSEEIISGTGWLSGTLTELTHVFSQVSWGFC